MAALKDMLETYLEAQPNAHVKLNQAVRWIRAAMPQFRIEDRDLATPPGSPADGALYLVAASPTGAWAGQAGNLALYYADSGWEFVVPEEGLTMWVKDENVHLVYNGTAWVAV